MNKKLRPSLRLDRTTIRALTSRTLREVAGGIGTDPSNGNLKICTGWPTGTVRLDQCNGTTDGILCVTKGCDVGTAVC